MKTNQWLLNPYLRGLYARELWGHHESWRRSARAEHPVSYAEKLAVMTALEGAYSRLQTHTQRHGLEVLAGNPTPLSMYGLAFAGH